MKKITTSDCLSFHFVVIADYGGVHAPDPAFSEIDAHLRRADTDNTIIQITEHPVAAFCTIETGFWIAQIGLRNEHPGLVIFSNTAPRGEIAWIGQDEQPFVYGRLDNGVDIFVVNSGYNLSFVKNRLAGPIYKVKVLNSGTQFRSRDQYSAASMGILRGEQNYIGEEIDIRSIPDIPKSTVASIDGYGNLKTTIRKGSILSQKKILESAVLRIKFNGISHFAINKLASKRIESRTGDLCLVVGSSGGKKDPFLEVIKLQASAAEEYKVNRLRDDMGEIVIDPI